MTGIRQLRCYEFRCATTRRIRAPADPVRRIADTKSIVQLNLKNAWHGAQTLIEN
jgi:hypothetical protein